MDIKSQANERFSRYAERYVHSHIHADRSNLTRLLEIANPVDEWLVLDIATGGGHTARTFAPYVRQIVAADLSQSMLNAAHHNLTQVGITNVTFLRSDAEQLPLPNRLFNLVTCRHAAHHFPDVFTFVQECARILSPGGSLLVLDHLVPEDEAAARYLNAYETYRDPAHHRVYSEAQWRGMLLDADMTVEHVEVIRQRANLIDWAERQDCPSDVIARLQVLLAQAPRIAKDWLRPSCVGTPDAEFDHVFIAIMGRVKPD